MIHRLRSWVFPVLGVLLAGSIAWAFFWTPALVLTGLSATLIALGIHDRLQRTHSILRNYPVLGHIRFLLEDVGPELRQYIVEHNLEGRPFDRDTRSLIYQRSKGLLDNKGFGTELDVYQEGHRWVTHSINAKSAVPDPVGAFRFRVGGPDCQLPYEASLLNISAMSFGSLSAPAVSALNRGARNGRFAHNTGEGGLSRYHLEPGGDLVWQVGTGYFGCRSDDGRFDADRFREQAAIESVRMIELKLSQGAKPGHGGILPGVKVTPEIAEARGVQRGEDCVSPPGHSAFDSPIGMLEFIAELRSLSGGKPVGIKLAIGEPAEFMSICRAIHETGKAPDFITLDGGEGGTGAAPIEFSDHMGMPVLEAIVLVHNALVGMGARERIRIFAAGKLVTSVDIAIALALGADGVNTARGFMFALGCIQSQLCHTNRCPVGVATQKAGLARALDVDSKAERVEKFHAATLKALAEVVGAAGLDHPHEFAPQHVYERVSPWEIRPFSVLYPAIAHRALLDEDGSGFLFDAWQRASATSFGKAAPNVHSRGAFLDPQRAEGV